MKGTIYKYTFPDGKVYIGQTIRPLEARHVEHITPSTGMANIGFWEAWVKYGTAELIVLEEIEADDEISLIAKLNLLEAQYIRYYCSTDPEYGYNRLSRSHTRGPAAKLLNKEHDRIFLGLWGPRYAFYDELRTIALRGNSGPGFSEEQKKFIREYVFRYLPFGPDEINIDNLDSLVNQYDEEPLEELLFAIESSCSEEKEILSSLAWEQVLEHKDGLLSSRVIQKIDRDGNIVKEYLSISEVMHDLGLKRPENIYNVLEGKQKTAYGYFWKRKENTSK